LVDGSFVTVVARDIRKPHVEVPFVLGRAPDDVADNVRLAARGREIFCEWKVIVGIIAGSNYP
jgi:hypothetical protein